MDAAGLLPMAVQVSSVSLPSLTTSSWLSMMGLPGGTEPQQKQVGEATVGQQRSLKVTDLLP